MEKGVWARVNAAAADRHRIARPLFAYQPEKTDEKIFGVLLMA